jgi:hypothetical protein
MAMMAVPRSLDMYITIVPNKNGVFSSDFNSKITELSSLAEKKKMNNREKTVLYFLCYSIYFAQRFTIFFNQLN